jgi:DNA-binding transcriptional LysR family regulator
MLNFLHIKYFHDAFKLGSFAEAARTNFVSRPAISQAVHALERELGEKLVHHRQRKAELTPKGRWFLEKSSELIKHTQLIEQQMKGAEPETAEPVAICTSHSLAQQYLGGRNGGPLAKISFPLNLSLGDAFFTRRMLESREVELGLAVDDGNFSSFDTAVVARGTFVLCEARACKQRDHLLIGDKGREVEALLQSRGGSPFSRVTRIQSWSVLASLAAQGSGRAWIPDFVSEQHSGLQVVRNLDTPKFTFRVLIVARKFDQISKNAKMLVNLLR